MALLALPLAACGEPPSEVVVAKTRVVPDGGEVVVLDATADERFRGRHGGAPGGMSIGSQPQGGDEVPLEWDVPIGWEELPRSGMRLANLRPAGDPDAECTLSILDGTGGGLASNLNRWCKQMGVEEMDDAAIDALPRANILGMEGTLLAIEGAYSGMTDEARDGWGLRGVVLPTDVFTIFIKMTGPADLVAAEAGAFDAFCASVRGRSAGAHGPGDGHDHGPDDGHDHGAEMASPGDPHVDPHAFAATSDVVVGGASGAYRYEVPIGWRDEGPRSMRAVNLLAGESTQCYVIELAGEAGGELANLNRWRAEVGLDPIDADGVLELERIDLLGGKAPLLEVSGEYAGMGAGGGEGRTVLGTLAIDPARSTFVKMVGPSSEVAEHRAAFLSFCASLESLGR